MHCLARWTTVHRNRIYHPPREHGQEEISHGCDCHGSGDDQGGPPLLSPMSKDERENFWYGTFNLGFRHAFLKSLFQCTNPGAPSESRDPHGAKHTTGMGV